MSKPQVTPLRFSLASTQDNTSPNLICSIVFNGTSPQQFELPLRIKRNSILGEQENAETTALQVLADVVNRPDAENWLGREQPNAEPNGLELLLRNLCTDGLAAAAGRAFDLMANYQELPLPNYSQFARAFTVFTGVPADQVELMPDTDAWRVRVRMAQNQVCEVTSMQAMLLYYKQVALDVNPENMTVLTVPEYWQEVALDADFDKVAYLSALLKRWQSYWTWRTLKALTTTDTLLLDRDRQTSWEELTLFMHCFDSGHDKLGIAATIDDDLLFGLAVQAMLQINEINSCIAEYVDAELGDDENGWTELVLSLTGEQMPESELENLDANAPQPDYMYCRLINE